MKVITSHTMRELDRRTILDYGIPGRELMERAGRCCADEICASFGLQGRCVVMAGKGNNGGDGYVIARLLSQAGWDVAVIILAEPHRITGDAADHLALLDSSHSVSYAPDSSFSSSQKKSLASADLIVDALLGTGIGSAVTGLYREAIELMNATGRPVVAVDIPSGIDGNSGLVMGCAVRAAVTVTFASAKLGHVFHPGAGHTGRLIISDIGIPDTLRTAADGFDFLDEATVRSLVRRRDRLAHKGHFGHCLIVAGSTGKTGAAALAANSCVRAGAGLVTLAVAEGLHAILEVKTTEAMTVPLPDSGGFAGISAVSVIQGLLEDKSAVAIGPGLGRHPDTAVLVRNLVETVSLPLVLDADALNALAGDITVLGRKRSGAVVLTPHPGEMARLTGNPLPGDEASRLDLARNFAAAHGVYLVLKGARTIIATPAGAVAINGSGNPGMASGGMGDVLTGIIVSLLGQGYDAGDACRLGVFLHGSAGDLVAARQGETGMCATDVQEMLPSAYRNLLQSTC